MKNSISGGHVFTSERPNSTIISVLSVFILVLGGFASIILVVVFPEFYHHGDIGIQLVWMEQWNKGWKEIYNTCSRCDYPLFGTFITAGIPKLLLKLGMANIILGYRFFLGIVDALNVFLLFLLFRSFGIRRAAFWAGIIGLSLSSWAGGAVWGNIDDVSHFFLLLILGWMILFNRSGKIPLAVYIVGCSGLMATLILTKHLNIFNIVALEFMLWTNIFILRRGIQAALYALGQVALLLVFTFWWDIPLVIDKPYLSHLQMIWGTRGRLGEFLSNNGINVWMLLGRDMLSSSASPLISDSRAGFLRWLTPLTVGIFLTCTVAVVIALSTFRWIKRNRQGSPHGLSREALLNLILFLAIVNLAFNVLMTGTHERYLYSFYPLMLLAGLGLAEYDKRFSRLLALLLVVGANVYGVFVLGILTGDFSYHFGVHRAEALFHAGLLALLLVITLWYQLVPRRESARIE